MSELVRRLFQPSRKQSIFRTERAGASPVGRVFGGLVVCLVLTALLTSERLVEMAERQEFGPSRDRWLAAAEAVDGIASAVAFDRPAAAIDEALGRNDDAPTDVVLGELAASPTTTVATTTTTVAPTTTAPPTDDSAEGDAATTTAPTTTVPTTTTEPPPPPTLGIADVNQPLRIWTGGDSLGEYVGQELLYSVATPTLTAVELDFVISTGLARPDYYDWPARLSEVMQREDRPQVVMFMVGGNDDQDLRVDGERVRVGTDEWRAAYRQRVATIMDIVAYPDVQMLWINLPPMRSDRREEISRDINAALTAEAELRPWVEVIDIVDMFTGPDGGYEQFIDAPDGGDTRRARANDGVHITRSASGWVAELVWLAIQDQWTFDELAPPTTAPTTTTTAPPPPPTG